MPISTSDDHCDHLQTFDLTGILFSWSLIFVFSELQKLEFKQAFEEFDKVSKRIFI